ncbi:MAG: hypothetical protein ABMA64_38370, partial [Myxococcota bacterium]
MDPVTVSAGAMLVGLALGPWAPAGGSAWIALGAAALAAASRRAFPLAAVAAGLWCVAPAPVGPALEGPLS